MTTYDILDLHSLALVSRNVRVRRAHCWELPPSLALEVEVEHILPPPLRTQEQEATRG